VLAIMASREILAVNVRALRQAQDLSQEELAHRADIDRTYISSIERSVYAASLDVLDRLAKALGVSSFELIRPPPDRSSTDE
jgi:transcriptional regulator with XRE-family HTH domain